MVDTRQQTKKHLLARLSTETRTAVPSGVENNSLANLGIRTFILRKETKDAKSGGFATEVLDRQVLSEYPTITTLMPAH